MSGRPRDRGIALMETALIAPVLFGVVFAIFEFGLFFRDSLTIGDAASDAARIGAIVGPDSDATTVNADFQIIKTIREAMASLDAAQIERIVIFHATGSSAAAPMEQITNACRNGVAGPRCNVYEDVNAAFLAVQQSDGAYFACPGSTVSCSYAPLSRDDGPKPADIHYLGVYIRFAHPSITGILGDRTIEQAAVVRLEPGSVQ